MPILGTVASQFAGKPFSSFESISSNTLASAETTIDFASIPQTYKHLQIRMSVKTTASENSPESSNILCRLNGNTGSNYTTQYSTSKDGNATPSGLITDTFFYVGKRPSATQSNYFNIGILDILDYTNTNKKPNMVSMSAFALNNTNAANNAIWWSGHSWTGSATAVTSISFTNNAGDFAVGSTFSLYGIKG